nr:MULTISPECIES: MFS transporter [unclassified Nesterenkonia]
MIGWGANQFASMLSFYQSSYGISRLSVTLMLSIYIVGLLPALLLGGSWSDRSGRKWITLAALILAMLGSVAMIIGAWLPPWIFLGRLLSGVATGIAMAATTSWIKELSLPPWDPAASVSSGARRASLFITGGFCIGPVVSGILATYAPASAVFPYATHIVLCTPLVFMLLWSPETRSAASGFRTATDAVDQLWEYAAAPTRFRTVIIPAAPWVFGSGTIGFAVVPQLMASSSNPVLHSTITVGVTMGSGVAVQSLGRKLDTPKSAKAIITALCLSLIGLVLALATLLSQSLWIGLLASSLLGAGYGLMLVAGTLEMQRLASPQHLGGAMGKFYALAYSGFLVPSIVSVAALFFSDKSILLAIAILACVTITAIAINSSRNVR